MAESYVRHVELLGFEKRFFPSQHYVSKSAFQMIFHILHIIVVQIQK